MRYTHSKSYKKQWYDTDKSHEEVIRLVWEERLPGDFDGCGEEQVFFAFSDGHYFRLDHEWYSTHEEEDGWTPHYIHEIVEVTRTDVPLWMRSERDWIVL
jgi:hypothetical protein